MGWFGIGDEVDKVGDGVSGVIQNIRSAFTGEIPPEVQLELARLETLAVSERWIADSRMPWWNSSRSIVFMALNFSLIIVILFGIDLEQAMFSTLATMTGGFNTIMVGGKSMEYLKAGRTP